MPLVRSVVLVDGENLVARFQQMVKKGYYPLKDVVYESELLVWSQSLFTKFPNDYFRISYFQSVVGGDHELGLARRVISSQTFVSGTLNSYRPLQITPNVFRKYKRKHKTRQVDINLTIEAMRMAYTDQVDVICVLSGDGDFVALYHDINRRGKKVVVAALSSGLSPDVPPAADQFIDLDSVLFSQKPSEELADFYNEIYRKLPKESMD